MANMQGQTQIPIFFINFLFCHVVERSQYWKCNTFIAIRFTSNVRMLFLTHSLPEKSIINVLFYFQCLQGQHVYQQG